MTAAPSAQELDEQFTMCNGNGRLCETKNREDETPCPRDATHSALAVFPDDHSCDIRNPVSLCHGHTEDMQAAFDDDALLCARCPVRPLTLVITPLGGRQ